MRIVEIRALRGPNLYSGFPVIFMKVDIGALEDSPTDVISGFLENIGEMMPTLVEHTCSPGRRGGFLERVERGTWAAHVVEHVAIELQCLAQTEVGFGKTVSTDTRGVYNVVYRYRNEKVGLRAGVFAVNIVKALFQGEITDVQPYVGVLARIQELDQYGPSTQSIVTEAQRRGITHLRLNSSSYVQLGQGRYQRRIQATVMDDTSALGVEIADDKERTKELLSSSMGIPVPEGRAVQTLTDALKQAHIIGYPLVAKPLIGNHGRGITTKINNDQELQIAFRIANGFWDRVLIEKHLEGKDYRLLVIDGKLVAAALREPAQVVGNGRDTIQDLIHETNNDVQRGVGHQKHLTQIEVDDMTEVLLAKSDLSLESIPLEGEKVLLKSTANISTGGTALDVTDEVHPSIRSMAERISRIIGLNVMGIDLIAPSLQHPLCKGSAGVLEVNSAPGFRMHLSPSAGTPRNVAAHVVDMLFPPGSNHTIPIVAVTGTNGKTTTTRLISHILGVNGSVVGMACTDGVHIGGLPIIEGDYSGPEGARMVLTDSAVDHAVLEVARGGILRRGLGFDECDVGVLLNISNDHLGEGDINTEEDLAKLKSTVIEAVRPTGYAVLNADDPFFSVHQHAAGEAKIIRFSVDPDNGDLPENLEQGHMNVILQDDMVKIQRKEGTSTVARISEIPIAFGGQALFNVQNVLAATAAALALGLTEPQVRAGLVDFTSSIDQVPGRMNIIEMGSFKAVVDYGHNKGAIEATGDFFQDLAAGRIIRMTSGTGNRRGEDIIGYGLSLSHYSDHVVLTDADPRNRPPGETARLVQKGLMEGGFTRDMVTMIFDERQATRFALDMAGHGDLVILHADNIGQVIRDVLNYRETVIEIGPLREQSGPGVGPSDMIQHTADHVLKRASME